MPLAFDASWTLVGALFAIGTVLAVAEIFIPSHGLLTVLAVGAFVAAVVAAFLMGQTEGMIALVVVVLLAPLLVYTAIRVWPHTPVAKRIILSDTVGDAKASDLARIESADVVGKIGTAKTLLRPSGKMVLGDRILDCVTEGDLVPAGRRVEILAVRGSQVVVRPVSDEADTA